jgi:hypothetical protein
MHRDASLVSDFLEGDGRDGLALAFVVGPDKARRRIDLKVGTEEFHGCLFVQERQAIFAPNADIQIAGNQV